MKNLKTSTKVLIALVAAALLLGGVLLLTVPEPWGGSIGEHHSFSGFNHEGGEFMGSFHNGHRPLHMPGGILLIGLILFFLFNKRGVHGRRNHSRAIIDEIYAEEKITLEEYQRRRIVIDEGGK